MGKRAIPFMICLAAHFYGLSAKAEVITVEIETMKFNPSEIKAKIGDTVIWNNKDIVPHTATAKNKEFDSKEIKPGHSWKKKFTKEVRISYKCEYHPTMEASLAIQ